MRAIFATATAFAVAIWKKAGRMSTGSHMEKNKETYNIIRLIQELTSPHSNVVLRFVRIAVRWSSEIVSFTMVRISKVG